MVFTGKGIDLPPDSPDDEWGTDRGPAVYDEKFAGRRPGELLGITEKVWRARAKPYDQSRDTSYLDEIFG